MQVFYGIPFKNGDRILTGVHEYAANYIAFLQVQLSAFHLSIQLQILIVLTARLRLQRVQLAFEACLSLCYRMHRNNNL